ncbi:MAG: dockerin type I domain-containing protein [Candidatus Bipolaricaulota bacterium]|nr:dockerin type I domain-containing protein [Candidatus Bipolaricaulota bacterium]MDW8126183.1 dockerin type I domain-containing protein [Candidatus Bipolaricaulota bacterium]
MKRAFLLSFFFVGFLGAAFEVNLLEVDLQARPGLVLPFSFIVRNELAQPEQIVLYLGDWDRNEFGENQFYQPGTLARSSAAWITVVPTSFVLGAGEVREIQGSVQIPNDAKPGTYWAMVFVQGEPRLVPYEGVMVTVTRRIGIKVYITVEPAEARGELRGVEVRGLNPLWAWVKFANTGTRNLREVRATLRVVDVQGRTVAEASAAPVPCLPGAERWIRVNTDFRPSPGVYQVLATVDYGGEALLGLTLRLAVRPLSLFPLGEGLGIPQDLDGNGFYEDVNGDSLFNEVDVEVLRGNLMSPVVRANLRAFDFNNDGVVDEQDVKALEALLAAIPAKLPAGR